MLEARGWKLKRASGKGWVMRFCLERGLISLFVLGVGIVFFARPSYSEGGEPRYFAVKNARIVPVSGPAIENGTVVIANGFIQAVGADVPIPPEAWVIDGKGLTVYPGLIDAGTDLGLPKPEEAAVPGESAGGERGKRPRKISTGPEDRPGTTPWKIAADRLKPDDKRIESWRNAGFTSTLTSPEGGIFPGQGSVINLAGSRAGEMVVKPDATLNLSFKPIGDFFSFPGSLMGVIAYVRQVWDDTGWYQQSEPIYEAHVKGLERPAYDRTERVLANVRERKEIVLLPANTSGEILRGLRLAEEWGIPATLYGGQQGYEVAGILAAKKMPVLVSLKWPEKAKDADPEAEVTLRELRFRDRAPSTPAAFARAGVKFALFSDGLSSPKDIQKNLKRAMDAGLSLEAALRAFTLDAAEILGVSDRLGSIEPGKIANLIVTEGELFKEKTKVKHVFVDGRWFQVHEEAPPEKKDDKEVLRDDSSAPQRRAASADLGVR